MSNFHTRNKIKLCDSKTKTLVQEHKEPYEQMLKKRFMSNFQTRNKIKLCDSKTKTLVQKHEM
jgi:hypothetical protein